MRGKVSVLILLMMLLRITPAYAGKSCIKYTTSLSRKDHPRLCGEKLSPKQDQCCAGGSPPPMRGKVHNHPEERKRVRITPAYAGKSQSRKIVT